MTTPATATRPFKTVEARRNGVVIEVITRTTAPAPTFEVKIGSAGGDMPASFPCGSDADLARRVANAAYTAAARLNFPLDVRTEALRLAGVSA